MKIMIGKVTLCTSIPYLHPRLSESFVFKCLKEWQSESIIAGYSSTPVNVASIDRDTTFNATLETIIVFVKTLCPWHID